MGVMNIQSFPIHFYVQRKSPFNLGQSVITFEVERGITLSIECTLKLKRGDRVDTMKGPYGTFEDNQKEHLTHFSGSLLDGDIPLI